MRNRNVQVASVILGGVCVLYGLFVLTDRAFAEKPTADKAAVDMAPLAFLAGSWHGEMWGGMFHAYYSTPDGGKVLSHSRLMKDGKVAFYEFEVFEGVDGKTQLTPHPGGKPAASFHLVKREGKTATFENPKKDFPTRIVYERVGDDALHITLSDPYGKSDKTEAFKLKRSS